jgi:hypothetical protein
MTFCWDYNPPSIRKQENVLNNNDEYNEEIKQKIGGRNEWIQRNINN